MFKIQRLWSCLLLSVMCHWSTQAIRIEVQPALRFTNDDGTSRYPIDVDFTGPIADTYFVPAMTDYILTRATRVCWSGLWRFYAQDYFRVPTDPISIGHHLINNGTGMGCSPLTWNERQLLAAYRSFRPLGCPGEISQKCISMYQEVYAGGSVVHYDQAMFDSHEILNLTIQVKSYYISAPSDTWEDTNESNDLVPVVKLFSGPNGDNTAGRMFCIVMNGRHGNDLSVAKNYYQHVVMEGSLPFASIRGRHFNMVPINCANNVVPIHVPQSNLDNFEDGVLTLYAK